MNVKDQCCSTTNERETIPSALALLHNQLTDCNDVLKELEQRIMPVLNPVPTAEVPSLSDQLGSDVRCSVASATDKVRNLTYRMASIISNLDL